MQPDRPGRAGDDPADGGGREGIAATKITRITAENILGLHAAQMTLDKPIALVAGLNAAAKSSLAEAIRLAMVGESPRAVLKKDWPQLVTEGAASGFCEVHGAAGEQYSIVLPAGGHRASFTSEALHFCLDAPRFAQLSPNGRREFLYRLMGLNMLGDEAAQRLLARGCDPERARQVAPLIRAGFPEACKESQGKAREHKGAWRQITGENWGSQKAEGWRAPGDPAPDRRPEIEQAGAILADCSRAEDAALIELTQLRERRDAYAAEQQRRARLSETAGKYAQAEADLRAAEAEIPKLETRLNELRQLAEGGEAGDSAPCPHCGGMIEVESQLPGMLVLRPHDPPKRLRDPDAAAKLPAAERALAGQQAKVDRAKAALQTADDAAKALDALGGLEIPPDIAAVGEAEAAWRERKQQKQQAEADARAAIERQREDTVAGNKTKQAALQHAAVKAWDQIAAALAPDGIPADILKDALGPVNRALADIAEIAGWPHWQIGADMEIRLEGHRPYGLCSESERWRADAMLAVAIACLSKVRLVILDRLDVLDAVSRSQALYWLVDLVSDDFDWRLDTAIVLGTLKAPPLELPEAVQGFWVEAGVVRAIEQSVEAAA